MARPTARFSRCSNSRSLATVIPRAAAGLPGRPGGTVGVTTWGPIVACAAARVWDEELDRAAAPTTSPLVSRHDLMDSGDKVRALLRSAGFVRAAAAPVAWAYRPTRPEFAACCQAVGIRSRRLSGLSAAARDEFHRRTRSRLSTLDDEAFVERGEVVVGTAMAPPASRPN